MPAADLVRIHVLGPLVVVRRDGSEVPVDAWRTGRTRDLLRLLALADGRPVRAAELAEQLWPSVDDDRRRNRLRTAASQIRRTMGSACVIRRPDGLVLEPAWVDAVQFLADVRLVHEAAHARQHGRVVTLAQRAERLYRADFQAHDDDAAWARAVRQDLAQARLTLLCQAADSALAERLLRDSLDFAAAAVRLDPRSESAHRALMRAHAELGETSAALRVFEAYRASIAEELGADPSPETQALHLQLLRELDA